MTSRVAKNAMSRCAGSMDQYMIESVATTAVIVTMASRRIFALSNIFSSSHAEMAAAAVNTAHRLQLGAKRATQMRIGAPTRAVITRGSRSLFFVSGLLSVVVRVSSAGAESGANGLNAVLRCCC